MKSNPRTAIALAIASVATLNAGCGKSNNTATTPTPTVVSSGLCTNGVPATNYPGSVCPGTGVNGYTGVCVPVNPSGVTIIGFSGNGYFDGINLIAGSVPGSAQTYGSLTVSASTIGAVAGYTASMSRTLNDGSIINAYMANTSVGSTTAAVQGTISLSASVSEDMYYKAILSGLISTYGQTNLCVSNLALNLGDANGVAYGGAVTMYVNGTSGSYPLKF